MPLFNPNSMITREALTDFAIAYANEQDDFIATKIFPVRTVNKRNGKFYQSTREGFRIHNADAPTGSEAKSGDYKWVSKNFDLLEKAWKNSVAERDAKDLDVAIADLDEEAVAQNMQILLLEMEVAAATKALTTSNYPASHVQTLVDATDTWSHATGGDPFDDIKTARLAVLASTGRWPNKMAVSREVYETLRMNHAVLDRFSSTTEKTPDIGALAALFELEEIIIGKVMKNTTLEGAADTMASVWSDTALVFYQGPAGLKTVTYGNTLMRRSGMYSKRIDEPKLGRQDAFFWRENGWEWAQIFGSTVSGTDGDSNAGALIVNTIG